MITTVIFLSLLHHVSSSVGDRSYVFHKCFNSCSQKMCQVESFDNWTAYDSASRISVLEDLIRWDCPSECRYKCMWQTVKAFKCDNLSVPQFYGKWPFVRLFGIQEPASALFSSFNLFFVCLMLNRFCHTVPACAPMYQTWITYSLFSIFSWIASTIFHISDTILTEKIDYFGALAFVLASIVVVHKRIYYTQSFWSFALSAILIAFYVSHISYMINTNFDYGYNMAVNITFGLVNCLGWLVFSLYLCDAKIQPYIWYCRLSIIFLMVFMSLELWDFAPIAWTLDAHALWHACSALLIPPWFEFAIADCNYLHALKRH